MKELSIFIDESGDFGEYDYRSPFYIISMVMHDQRIDISTDLEKLNNELSLLGYSDHCVHAGPIIRQESEYRFVELGERQKILKKLMTFLRKININCNCVYIEKKHIEDEVAAVGKLGKQIANFIRDNYSYFLSFDKVIIYYDNGQVELTKILTSVFNTLYTHVEFRKVKPVDYKLFQIADLICTMELLAEKAENNSFTHSEIDFFDNIRDFKKNYLKHIRKKLL